MIKESSNTKIFLLFIFIAGIILRTIWVEDMEWKFDEKWMFDNAQLIVKTNHWPALGVESGAKLKNPGFSVWFFGILSYFSHTPIGVTRIIQWLNIFSLFAFLLFALKRFSGLEKKEWIWGLALASVSPLAVIFSRKIWAQDVLPLFSVLIIISHTFRHLKMSAFTWGLIGALVGQIHMSGFFFSFGIFFFTLARELYLKSFKTKWTFWILGSLVGSISLIPWLSYLLETNRNSVYEFKNLFQFRFYTYWIMDVLGIHLKYSLGKHLAEFIKGPIIFGFNSYLAFLSYLFLSLFGLYYAVILAIKARSNIINFNLKNFITNMSETQFYIWCYLLIVGPVLTLTGIKIRAHYLIILFPFMHIALVRFFLDKTRLLKVVILANLLLTSSFLYFVHIKGDLPKGDYGKSYKLIKNVQ